MRSLTDSVAMAKACSKAVNMTDQGGKKSLMLSADNNSWPSNLWSRHQF